MTSIASTILDDCLGLSADATRRALARGARVVSTGGSTEAMLARLLGADLDIVAARSCAIADALSAVRTAHVTCPAGSSLAELGIGAHHAARICGNVLEDEKALGSAHLAFGSSSSFGGTVTVAVHIDCVVPDARIALDGQPFDPAAARR